MGAIGGYIHGMSYLYGTHRLSFPGTIIPESSLHATFSFKRALIKPTFKGLVVGKVATGKVFHILLSDLLLNTFQNGHSLVRCSIIVTPHHRLIIGIRTDDCDFLLGEWQNAVVLQQDHTLTGHIKGYLLMFLTIHLGVRNLRPRH